MKRKNKHWKELVSLNDPANRESLKEPSGLDANALSDYQWLLKTRQQLKRVFDWDTFDKQAARLKLDRNLQKEQKNGSYHFMQTVWFRAAVILIAIISGAFVHFLLNETFRNKAYSEITVPPGQMTQLKLPDGTMVWLNSGTTFKYPVEFDQSSREVYIDGQAYLEVVKNAKKPFVVNTTKFSVQVLGTTFNLTAYSGENSANVTLIEGSVQIRSGNNQKANKIVPGQSATIVDGKLKGINEVNTEFYTSWREGKIVFRKESLDEIAKKLERWYNVEIRFADEDLKKIVYSGTLLKYKPIEQVFKSFILLNKDVDFVSESRVDQKDIIYIKKRNAKNNMNN